MRRLAFVAGLVLVTVGLAGCMGGGGDGVETEPQATSGNGTGPTLDEPNVSFTEEDEVYSYEAESTHEVRWENASFSPASCFACPNSEHRYDVTQMLPSGAPALLQAEVEASTNTFTTVSVSIETDGAQTYTTNGSFQEASSVLAPQGGTVEVVVQNGFPDANTEINYELRIQVDANRTLVPAGVPVSLSAPEDPAGLVVEPVGLEGEARVMLWDGQDTFLGHHAIEERTTINVTDAEGGPLVAFLAGAEGVASLAPVNASASGTEMRPLGWTWTETADSISGGELEVVAEPDTVPLQAGLFLRGNHETGTQYSGELATGNATLLSFESGGYYTGPGGTFQWLDERGAADLVPGEYVGTFQFSQATGGEAGVMWLTYQR